MGNTKLTLSADQALIEQAKSLAAKRKTSLSAMVSAYFRSLAAFADPAALEIPPLTRQATGLISLPSKASYKRLLEDALWEKHALSD